MQINDLFGAAAAFETVRMPDGTEAAIPTEHAAVIYVNEQPAFRVVCTPQLLPQLALGRLLTEGWIASAEEVEQIAVCAEGLKVNIYLNHPLTARRAAAQEVSSCCTDNVALGSPVEVQPLRTVPHLDVQPEWVDALAAAMSAGLPLYQATHAVHSCFVLHEGRMASAGPALQVLSDVSLSTFLEGTDAGSVLEGVVRRHDLNWLLSEVDVGGQRITVPAMLHPVEALLPNHQPVMLNDEDAARFLSGLRRRTALPDAPEVVVYAQHPRRLLGTAHITAGELVPVRLLNPIEIEHILTQATSACP